MVNHLNLNNYKDFGFLLIKSIKNGGITGQILYSNNCIAKDDFVRKVSNGLVDKIGTKKWTYFINSTVFGNVDAVLDSYISESSKADFINKCKDQPYYEPYCFRESKHNLKWAYDNFKNDLDEHLACYEKDKTCDSALKFSQKFNFDYADVVADNKRIEKEQTQRKRKEILGKIANFLKD